jgi:nitrous oxidase accessory protein
MMVNQRYILFFFFCFFLQRLHASVLHVGKGYSFTSIQKAIDASKKGDTILVHPGIYKEQTLTINKSVIIKGINYPVLDGEKKFEVVAVRASNATLDGFKIQHSGASSLYDLAGITIYNCKNVTILNNLLDDNFFGIYSQYSANCIIKNNKLRAYSKREQEGGNGIHCLRCDSMQIIHNTIIGHRDGIYFEFVTNSVVWRNTSKNNLRYGLHFMISHNNSYFVNIFKGNGAGVAVMYTHGVKMCNNLFKDNNGEATYSLLLKEISDSYIRGNHFLNNTSGIFMEGCSRIQMQNNLFKDNGYALQIQANCENDTITRNNFINNTFDVSTNGSLVLNKFQNNYWDKYDGYDLNKDKTGDVPYRPVSLYSMLVERNSTMMMLFRSFIVSVLDKTEKIIPSIIPEDLKDDKPSMKPLPL